MFVAQYEGARSVRTVELPAPSVPGPGEVQIAVSHVGICGTDLHIVHGAMDARVTTPLVFGHEVSARVVAVGDDVSGWAIGDKACVFPLLSDGTCDACQRGFSHICRNLNFVGIDSPGGLQQIWNVSASVLVPIPSSVSLRDAALVEPVAVAVHDVRRAGVTAGSTAVILGGGPIGALIAAVASELGARVAVAELDPERRRTLDSLGILTAPAGDGLVAWVEEWTNGVGADFVFEVSGSAAAALQAPLLARVRGTVVIVAIHAQPPAVDLHRVFWRELTLIGTRVYDRSDFDRAIELIESGAIPTSIVTHVLPLERVEDAFAALSNREAMKVLIAVSDDER